MKRVNKDGRPIFSDEVWNNLVKIGQRLEHLGYKEKPNKPNLFSRSVESGILYADMRGTDEVLIWDAPCPLLYFYPTDENMPDDEKRVILKSEFNRLKSNDCQPRFSFYDVSEPDGLFFGDEDVSSELPMT